MTGGNGTCRKQEIENGNCLEDDDCVNTAGCNLDNKCKTYFSVNSTNETVKYIKGDLSFCASGLATVNGTCINKRNLGDMNFPCNDTNPCTYVNTFDNTTITDLTACACSQGPNGTSYCPIGNGEPEYQAYISEFKKYLQNSADAKCHTLERKSCPALDQQSSNSQKTLRYRSIVAKNIHLIRDSPECVKMTIYPDLYYQNNQTNQTSICPKVSCGKLNKGVCGLYNVLNTSKIFIGQLCSSGNYCPLQGIFENNETTSINCTSKQNTERFPGEKCDAKNTCISSSNCNSNVCSGKAEKETCISHLECKVGLYCSFTTNTTNGSNGTNVTLTADNTTGVCVSQVNSNENCTHDYMCKNNQGCLNGKCVDYFSLNLGQTVGNTSSLPELLCKSNLVVNNTCYGLAYYSSMEPDTNNMVKCKFNESNPLPCVYRDIFNNTIKEACQCSYDKDGNSYCRKAYNESDNNWIKLANTYKQRMDSKKCHTLNRNKCYDTDNLKSSDLYDAKINTVEAHNLFYAEDCIRKLFIYNAGEFIKLSFVIIAALIMSLF